MNLTSRSLVAAIAVLAVAVGLGFVVVPTTAVYLLLIVGVIGAFATIIAGSCPLPTGLEKLPLALGQAAEGKAPEPPPQTSPVVSGVFHQTQQLAASVARLKESNKHDRRTIQAVRRAIEDLINGRDISHDDLLEEAGMLGSLRQLAQLRAQHPADNATAGSDQVAADLDTLEQSTNSLDTVVSQLDKNLTHLTAIGETADESLEHLSEATKLSSVHLSAMVETREKLRGEFEDLISHARETGTSIEEMAFSIQEVAKNVDALALTAEETSSSMNEMDVAIDQVQSNATDTTRLSEKVTRDAEQGGQAIMKTIEEIQRIDESTREAVEVIANLGTRIEAISGILRVIDDVAEQTNLLALNAAIIAAQAGEHGKGFAVVADEIKDLADRAGTSTREIAELTRTIQAESKNAVMAVQRGAENVKRGVEVSNEAEYALKQILESSRKSTAMVQTIARATLEQTRGSRQVTDAISTIAQTVQQIATTTNEQAKSSEFVMRGVETIRQITDRVEQGETEQHHVTSSVIETLSKVDKATHNLKHRSTSLADVAVDLGNQVDQIRATTISQREAVGRLNRECKPARH